MLNKIILQNATLKKRKALFSAIVVFLFAVVSYLLIGYFLIVNRFTDTTLSLMKNMFTCDCSEKIWASDIMNISAMDDDDKLDDPVKIIAKSGRILCWISTYPANHSKAYAIKNTWGKRCDHLLFMSTRKDDRLPTIAFKAAHSGRTTLWNRTKQALIYIYENYYDKAEWFLKADEDTYVIMENLRFLLASYNSTDPIYMGSRYKTVNEGFFKGHGYMSGGAGYVLAKGALKLFIEKALYNKYACWQNDSEWEDIQLGNCLGNVGVGAVDTRDTFKLHRFFHGMPTQHLVDGAIPSYSKYWQIIYYPDKQGVAQASKMAISFHHLSNEMINVLEYFIYYMNPYGIIPTFPKYEILGNDTIEWPNIAEDLIPEDSELKVPF